VSVTAVAQDAAGNKTTSAVSSWTVNNSVAPRCAVQAEHLHDELHGRHDGTGTSIARSIEPDQCRVELRCTRERGEHQSRNDGV